MPFEWDERKREANLAKHLIGLTQGIEVVVVYVVRGKRRRTISARRAHRNERQDYANHLWSADEEIGRAHV